MAGLEVNAQSLARRNASLRYEIYMKRMGTDMNVQFRAEFFNVFNQVNFDLPNRNVSGANFGVITRTDPSFGDPRILQFGLKFVF